MCSVLQACLLAWRERYVWCTKPANFGLYSTSCTAYTVLLVQLERYFLYSSCKHWLYSSYTTSYTACTVLLVQLIQFFLYRDVQDAFATADDDVPALQPAGRTLSSQKSKKSQRDPSLQHAEQILAAGSDALKMQQQ